MTTPWHKFSDGPPTDTHRTILYSDGDEYYCVATHERDVCWRLQDGQRILVDMACGGSRWMYIPEFKDTIMTRAEASRKIIEDWPEWKQRAARAMFPSSEFKVGDYVTSEFKVGDTVGFEHANGGRWLHGTVVGGETHGGEVCLQIELCGERYLNAADQCTRVTP